MISIYRSREPHGLDHMGLQAYNIRVFTVNTPIQTQGGSGGLEALSLIK